MTDKPLTFEEFKSIYSKVPRLCVDVVIQNEHGTLLTRRDIAPYKGQWHLPGGTVYFKETLEEAAVRIAQDELGVEVTVENFLGCVEFMHADKAGGFDHPISLVFKCAPFTDSYASNEQSSSIEFFTKIPNDTIAEQKEFLENLPVN